MCFPSLSCSCRSTGILVIIQTDEKMHIPETCPVNVETNKLVCKHRRKKKDFNLIESFKNQISAKFIFECCGECCLACCCFFPLRVMIFTKEINEEIIGFFVCQRMSKWESELVRKMLARYHREVELKAEANSKKFVTKIRSCLLWRFEEVQRLAIWTERFTILHHFLLHFSKIDLLS